LFVGLFDLGGCLFWMPFGGDDDVWWLMLAFDGCLRLLSCFFGLCDCFECVVLVGDYFRGSQLVVWVMLVRVFGRWCVVLCRVCACGGQSGVRPKG
jgi:hypothetical protein